MRELFEQGRIDAPITWRTRSERVPGLFDVLAEDVDGLMLHHALDDRSIELVRGLARRRVGPRVLVLDDLLEALPPYNPLQRRMLPDVRDRIARVLEHCTCLVTTSAALADAYRALAPRVVVIENALPDRPWLDLAAPKRATWRAGRPRVGWAGAGQHAGDLASIEALVRSRRDVQWVFMGMAPNGAREAGAEIHAAVPFRDYPERLAALDLDLALAPLVDNAFNLCKSALKVIELGALGVPVVASDLRPYRNTPAILVADDMRAWNAAIDEWAFDFERCRAKGSELRAWVLASHRLAQRAALWMDALELEHAGPTAHDPAAAPALHRAAEAIAAERATA
jgi:glycosyltransferase involved in cell wall biosynthesis